MYAITEFTKSSLVTEIIFTSDCKNECENKLKELILGQDKFIKDSMDHLSNKLKNLKDDNFGKKLFGIKNKVNSFINFSIETRIYQIIEISNSKKINKIPYYEQKDIQSICYKNLN